MTTTTKMAVHEKARDLSAKLLGSVDYFATKEIENAIIEIAELTEDENRDAD